MDESAAVCEFQAEVEFLLWGLSKQLFFSQIGDRVVIGEVNEKEQAKREYQQAVQQGPPFSEWNLPLYFRTKVILHPC